MAVQLVCQGRFQHKGAVLGVSEMADPKDNASGAPRYYPPAERAEMIERTSWAREFNWDQIQALSTYFAVATCAKGEEIFTEGGRVPKICLIISGAVEVVKRVSPEHQHRLALIGAGKTIGEMSMLDGQPHSATIVALHPTTLLILTRQEFDRLLDEVPRLGVKLLLKVSSLLSQRLRRASGILVDYLEAEGHEAKEANEANE